MKIEVKKFTTWFRSPRLQKTEQFFLDYEAKLHGAIVAEKHDLAGLYRQKMVVSGLPLVSSGAVDSKKHPIKRVMRVLEKEDPARVARVWEVFGSSAHEYMQRREKGNQPAQTAEEPIVHSPNREKVS